MYSMISVPIYDTHGPEGCVYILNHGKISIKLLMMGLRGSGSHICIVFVVLIRDGKHRAISNFEGNPVLFSLGNKMERHLPLKQT